VTNDLGPGVTYRRDSYEQQVPQMVDTSPAGLAALLLGIINTDRDRLEYIDRYVNGTHDLPYMPVGADAEYRMLAERSITNFIPLFINTPAQALYLDSVRRGPGSATDATTNHRQELPEWKHWQQSRLDGRQLAITRGALKFGHSFTLTELDRRSKKVLTKGLSAMNTAAVYVDPANDIDPYAALTVTRYPNSAAKTEAGRTGTARLWDGAREYAVTFTSLTDLDSVRVDQGVKHGLKECPVTRFSASVDLEGRTCGVVERVIQVQDRINQTVFDLMVAQTYGSFKVRWITGMAPPVMRWTQLAIDAGEAPEGTEEGDVVVDPHGNPIPRPINMSASRYMFAEDENVKFGQLDETPLKGYIESLDMSLRHLSVLTQTPPHYLLGEIANLAAEALQAAETALLRMVEEYRKSFGESWERVFRLAAGLLGDTEAAEDYSTEVMWRDIEMRSLSATADALVKLKELGIPLMGLWNRVPEVTRGEIETWMRQREEDMKFRKDLAEIELIAQQRVQVPVGVAPPTAAQVDSGSEKAPVPAAA
jgi:hypothetical protein